METARVCHGQHCFTPLRRHLAGHVAAGEIQPVTRKKIAALPPWIAGIAIKMQQHRLLGMLPLEPSEPSEVPFLRSRKLLIAHLAHDAV